MTHYISLIAIVLYLMAAWWLGNTLFPLEDNTKRRYRLQFFISGYLALFFHGIVLYQHINIAGGLNLGFYNALSLMSGGVSLLVMVAALSRPLENLAVAIFPVTAIALLMEIFFQSSRVLPDNVPPGLRLHVLLSVCAYSLLTLAAFQSVLLALQDRQISHKRPASILRLPPIQIMEDLLIKIIATGFFMLSLSLVSGLMFVQDLFAQHLVHKTVLSILAWIIFGILLWGHWTRGWRGKKAVRWTIGGFLSLMLAYFGSKIVLELILKRV
jgi:ABC-type uncharacterized transport system, permease component